jgi:hypothetical protein
MTSENKKMPATRGTEIIARTPTTGSLARVPDCETIAVTSGKPHQHAFGWRSAPATVNGLHLAGRAPVTLHWSSSAVCYVGFRKVSHVFCTEEPNLTEPK